MGLHFGELYKMRGIVMYRLSPFEQFAFAGMIKKGLPNIFRRIGQNILYIGPPAVIGYMLFDWAQKEHLRLQRKNPADYANDE